MDQLNYTLTDVSCDIQANEMSKLIDVFISESLMSYNVVESFISAIVIPFPHTPPQYVFLHIALDYPNHYTVHQFVAGHFVSCSEVHGTPPH